jgi:acylpyruvate hydrolase
VRLATVRSGDGTTAVRLDGDTAVDLGYADVGALLADPDWRALGTRDGARLPVADLSFAPLIPRPEKIVCVGLNYRNHILEMGRELPEFPTLFAKYPPALIGATDDIMLPDDSAAMDWEAELAVIVGRPVRRADRPEAAAAIAGYSVLNDITARDWQYRTAQWLQGKTFEATTPLGPWLVTPDEAPDNPEVSCEVDGEVVQRAPAGDLVFGPAELISYISRILTLVPGDVIATGTPGGVGHARKPPRHLAEGSVVVTRIEGVGECRNVCRADKPG